MHVYLANMALFSVVRKWSLSVGLNLMIGSSAFIRGPARFAESIVTWSRTSQIFVLFSKNDSFPSFTMIASSSGK